MAFELSVCPCPGNFAGGFLSGAAAAAPPIEAFGRKPAVIDVDVNPAGTRLAWMEEDGKTSRLIIIDLATGKDLRTVTAPDGVKLWRLAGQTMKACSSARARRKQIRECRSRNSKCSAGLQSTWPAEAIA